MTVACSRTASSAIFAFSPASIRRLVFFVIVRSVYQTEPPFSNLTSGPKNGVHFMVRWFKLDEPAPSRIATRLTEDSSTLPTAYTRAPSRKAVAA